MSFLILDGTVRVEVASGRDVSPKNDDRLKLG
jgi:hypothetical protein